MVLSSNGKNSDVYFFLQAPIIVGNDHEIVMRIENFVCPISFFVVNDSNNTLIVDDTTYTIPEGNYSANSLKTELASLLGYTVSYSSITNKLTFENSTEFTFSSSSTCFRVIGFDEDTDYGPVTSLTSTYIVNLSGTPLIYIDIPNITTRNISAKSGGGYTTIMKSIVQDVPYGSVLSYINNTNSAVMLQDKYIGYIRVRLLDYEYNLLDLNNQHFTMTIEAYYYYNGKPAEYTGSLAEAALQQETLKKNLGLSQK